MEPVELVTSKAFSQDELITSLLQIGIERDEDSYRLWDYIFFRGVTHEPEARHRT
jgi:hypothetical protein